MWVHEYSDWPSFSWDDSVLAPKLADIRYRQGLLLGRMEHLGFDLKSQASLRVLTSDVVKSSAIEGELLNPEEVRSSIARRLGINLAAYIPASRNVEGIVDVLLDATQNFKQPLTKDRLLDWHAALFPTGRSGMQRITVGDWRDLSAGAMQVVSGPIGREKVHFEAPSADRLESEMQAFLKWLEAPCSTDPVLKAGVAHFYFVTIHPFEDGNGRIARVIGDMLLARADGIAERFYSLSTQIEAERKDYYTQLERQQRTSLDITPWLDWFLDCLGRAIDNAQNILAKVLFKAEVWERSGSKSMNTRQQTVLNRMLESDFQGHMQTAKYAKLAKCSTDTALRDIQDLVARGIFIKNPASGRSTSYRLASPSSQD